MNDEQKKTYVAWLNDAHAMEEGLITVLEKQVKETEGQPDMQAEVKQHLEETKRHRDLMEAALKRNDSSPSTTKDVMSKMGAMVNGLGMSMMSDAMVKNVYTSYGAEHFEIASYTALQAASRTLGDMETMDACESILQDEINMANFLLKQLPMVVEMQMREGDTRKKASGMAMRDSSMRRH